MNFAQYGNFNGAFYHSCVLLWHYTILIFLKTIYRLPGEHVDVAASL